MTYKVVGVDSDTSLFPPRVMNALKSLFGLKADLSTVATSGRYSDLSERPAIPSTPNAVGAEPAGLSTTTRNSFATVASTGSYSDLTNKPIVPGQMREDPNDPGTYLYN